MKNSDSISKKSIKDEFLYLNSSLSKTYIKCFKTIDSTSSYAKNILSKNKPIFKKDGSLTSFAKKYNKSLFVAETQTAGRGRLGRTFISPEKTGIYFSFIYIPQEQIIDVAKITVFSAVAICNVLARLYKIQPKIKWINDIFINDKKVCGILTEGIHNIKNNKIESFVIGIGLNIFDNSAFDNSLKNVAGSLFGNFSKTNSSLKKNYREKIISSITNEFFYIIQKSSLQNIINEYRNLSFLIGKTIDVHPIIDDTTSCYKANVVDIDNNANLVVKLEDGSIKKLSSGEVSIRSKSIFEK